MLNVHVITVQGVIRGGDSWDVILQGGFQYLYLLNHQSLTAETMLF